MDIKKRVDKIWKENSKIPFMQSKEILAYGYEAAINDISRSGIPDNHNAKAQFSPKTEQVQSIDQDPEYNRLTGMREAYYKAKFALESSDRVSAYQDISSEYQEVVKKIRNIENDKGKNRRDRKK